ncbi:MULTISPECIES: hypothetical protein [Streptomyces]|uniref:Uncharacterized protein n=1 Tax=Streptomyces lavendofoliae TaxID=67314 RepID=A0A918I3A8_9ACTN|nr:MULTISPECIES: hypothetical protein [Streptomyces]GGU62501.1 hypothetical protein GCM10010274_59120 [Streptomyces lavendofoliae]
MAIPPNLDRNALLFAGLLLAAYVLLPRLTTEQLAVLGALASLLQPIVQAALSRRE